MTNPTVNSEPTVEEALKKRQGRPPAHREAFTLEQLKLGTWICVCGTYNNKSRARCRHCERAQPPETEQSK